MPSGQETDWAYSPAPGVHAGQKKIRNNTALVNAMHILSFCYSWNQWSAASTTDLSPPHPAAAQAAWLLHALHCSHQSPSSAHHLKTTATSYCSSQKRQLSCQQNLVHIRWQQHHLILLSIVNVAMPPCM